MVQDSSFTRTGCLAAGAAIEYGLIDKEAMDAAAQIYVDSFPQRVGQWFNDATQARQFYCDLMHLMRLSRGDTFFAARQQNRLIGYLILALPHRSLFPALFREHTFSRLAVNFAMGRYGFAFQTLVHAFKALFAATRKGYSSVLVNSPHVYVLVVAKAFSGRGIGSALIERAKAASISSSNQMWLHVDIDNADAIRFYRRIGFLIVATEPLQHLMVWRFSDKSSGQPLE